MNKDWKIYESDEDWRKLGKPEKSYIKLEIPFDIACKECKGEAIGYHEFEDNYDCQNIIICKDCDNEVMLYGCDG
jgi:hypothetical protein